MHAPGPADDAGAGGSSKTSSENHENDPDQRSSNEGSRSSQADPLFLTFYSVPEAETHALLAALDCPFFQAGRGAALGPLQPEEAMPSPEGELHAIISEKMGIPALLERLRALSIPPPPTPSNSGPSPPSSSFASLSPHPVVAAAAGQSGSPIDALNSAGGYTVTKREPCVEGTSDKAIDSPSRAQPRREGEAKQQLPDGNPKTQACLPPSSSLDDKATPESADSGQAGSIPQQNQRAPIATNTAGKPQGILNSGSKSSRASSANSAAAEGPSALAAQEGGSSLNPSCAEKDPRSPEESRRELQHAILCDLFLNALVLCKEEEFSPEATSTFLGILKKTLEDSMRAEMTPAESFSAFRSLLLKYAIQRPPLSIKVFTVRTLQAVMNHVVQTFYRHYHLYVHCFVPLKHLVLHQTPTAIPPRLLRSVKPKKNPWNPETIPNLGLGFEAMQEFLKDMGDDTDTPPFTQEPLTPGILPESEWNELLWGEGGDENGNGDPFSLSGGTEPKYTD